MERFTHSHRESNEKESRENLVKATAFFDAGEYIELMKKESPSSLEVGEDGEIVINLIEGGKMVEATIQKLNLDMEERFIYLEFLKEAIKDILSKKM